MKWTDAELAMLRELYGTMPVQQVAQHLGRSRMAVLQKASQLGLDGKPKRWTESEKALLAHFFPTTPVPDVASMLGRPVGQVRGMAGTLGLRRTAAAKATVAYKRLPVGSERPNQHGQMMRKVRESGPYREAWTRVDILTWEEAHGPVPKGMMVTACDSTKPPTLDNLMLVSRADLAKRNSPNNYPPEVAALLQLKGAIARQLNRLEREQTQAA